MSKVYSFRLNDENPREVQAREVINAWISKGYSLRQIVVEALLTTSKDNDSKKSLEQLVEKVEMLLEKVDLGDIPRRNGEKADITLPTSFLNSISIAIKPGEKLI